MKALEVRGVAIPIEDMKIPPILYKFRDYDNKFHRKTLFQNEIYIPSANEFNDPLDSKTPFRYREEDLTDENIYKKCLEIAKYSFEGLTEEQYQNIAYENQNKQLLFDEHHLEQFDQNNYRYTCNNYGIFCLTPDSVNFLMWSYYSNSHRGFCIGYNTSYLLGTSLFSMGGIVDYKNEFPKIPLFLSEHDQLFLNIFYTKNKVWVHENEYRLIQPYSRGKVFILEKKVIAEIVFGCQFPKEELNRLLPELIKLYPNATIYSTKLVTGKFGLFKDIIYDPSLLLDI